MGRNLKRFASALIILCAVLCLFIPSLSFSDSAEYTYDDTGRLRAVIDSSSNELIYNYDEVGNLLSINKKTVSGTLAITDFDPHEGAAGTIVTIYGKGFSTTPANNIVKFNGIQTSVSSSTVTKMIVTAPAGVTTGKITVTNSNGTATSLDDFVVAVLPTAITVQPETAFMFAGSQKQFKAYADGVETKKVAWSVEGGSSTYGTITMGGLYIGPIASPIIDETTITATSLLDPTKSGNAKVYFNSAIVSSPVCVSFNLPSGSLVNSKPVSIAMGTLPAGSTVNSSQVSVNIGSIPGGSVVSSKPVSVSRPPTIDSLVSRPVSVASSTAASGITVSMPVCVKIASN